MAKKNNEGVEREVVSETAPKRGRSAASANQPAADGTSKTAAATGGAAKGTAAKGTAAKGTAAKGAAAKPAGRQKADSQEKTTSASGARGGAARGKGAGAKAGSQPDLRQDLRDFAAGRPHGWNHDDWTSFLEHLQSRGHNVNDRDQIGTMLERERLALQLEKVPGMGPQRVQSIADKYGYLWRLRETDADELARDAGIPRSLAEKVVQAVRS